MANLRRKFRDKFQEKQDIPYTIAGLLGNSYGVVNVPDRNNYVYVRLAGSGVAEVFNNRVQAIFDLPVICGYDPVDPQRFQVLSIQGSIADAVGSSIVYGVGYAPSERYRWMYPGGGQDPLFSELRQLMPLRISPIGAMKFTVHNQVIRNGETWAVFGGSAETDLTNLIPTTAGKCCMVLISIDANGAIETTKGTEVDIADLVVTDIPSPPDGTQYVLGAIRLYYGQTQIQEARTNTDVVDLRFPQIAGTSLSKLDDVDLTGLADGDILIYDGASSKWLPQTHTYLESTEILNPYAENATSAQTIPTSDGSGDAIHPSVVDMYEAIGDGETWNGYRYWMAMTPFTGGDIVLENPEIVASNDGNTWEVPSGLTNPIDAFPDPHHNADTELILGQDNSLYCFYIDVTEGSPDTIVLKVRSSSDGVTWSAETDVLTLNNSCACPTVLWDGTQYVLWYLNYNAATYLLKKRTSSSLTSGWSAEVDCTMNNVPTGENVWNIDIVKRGSIYHGVFGLYDDPKPIYFGYSTDGVAWYLLDDPLLEVGAAGSWDDGFLYRATLVPTANGYDMWYSANDQSGAWVNCGTGRTTVYLNSYGGIFADGIWKDIGDLAVGTGYNTAERLAVGTEGQHLVVSGGIPAWADNSAAAAMSDLTDVDLTDLADGDVLVYDETSGNWLPEDFELSLDELSDVDITGSIQGDIIYNSDGSNWLDYALGIGLYVVVTDDVIKLGNAVGGDFLEISKVTGNIRLAGLATGYRDLLQALIGQKLESPASDITLDLAEGTVTFDDSCTLSDYVVMNVQINHDWKIGSNIYPHLHWFQASANIPNWLIQYRWQLQGSAKTTAWTPVKYVANVFTYTSGTLNQITSFGAIEAPEGAGLSDIVQFRLLRDTNDDSTLFGDTDPLTGDAETVNFDVHYQVDGFGSDEEYTKIVTNMLTDSNLSVLLDDDGNLLVDEGE